MTNIHFCWFGSPVPLDVLARLDRWQKLHPSWTIPQWNESNIDVSSCAYAKAWLEGHLITEFLKANPKWKIHWKEIGA